MANGQDYESDPTISNPQYETVIGSEHEEYGVKAKMIHRKGVEEGKPSSLPQYAGHSNMYFLGYRMGEALSAKLYKEHRMVMDFDWGHTHVNKPSGEVFHRGTVHIQEYHIGEDGKITRASSKARLMTQEEIELYGSIILRYNPNVKFS